MPCRARSTSDTTRTPTLTSTCQPGAAQNAGGRCLGLANDIPMRGCGAVSFGAGWTPTPNAPCLWWISRTRLIPGSGLPQRGHRTGSACAHPHAQDPRYRSSPDRVDSERAGDSPVRLPLCRLGKIRTAFGVIIHSVCFGSRGVLGNLPTNRVFETHVVSGAMYLLRARRFQKRHLQGEQLTTLRLASCRAHGSGGALSTLVSTGVGKPSGASWDVAGGISAGAALLNRISAWRGFE